MATLNKFDIFVADVANKVHNLGADVLKVALTNTLPVAGNTILANITQISGGGYAVATAALVSSTQTAGLYKLIIGNALFTSTGTMGPFQYAVLYNSTPANGNLIGWYNYGSAVTLNNTETFTVVFDQTNGEMQLQ